MAQPPAQAPAPPTSQGTGPSPKGPATAALTPAALAAVREQVLGLIMGDPEIQAKLRALNSGDREIGAAEAGQIMDLIEKQVGGLLDKRIERVVRSLVRPDYLLRPHLRPDALDHRP